MTTTKTHKDFADWLTAQQAAQLSVAKAARKGVSAAATEGAMELVLGCALRVAFSQGALAVYQRALVMADGEADWLSIALEIGGLSHVMPTGTGTVIEQSRQRGQVMASREISAWIQYERTGS